MAELVDRNRSIFSRLPKRVSRLSGNVQEGNNINAPIRGSILEDRAVDRTVGANNPPDVATLLNNNEGTIYGSISARRGSDNQPFIIIKPNEPGRRDVNSNQRGFPLNSSLTDQRRLGAFLKTAEGVVFAGKQFFLQSLNPTLETKVWNPISINASAAPFVHTNRHLSLSTVGDLAGKLIPGTSLDTSLSNTIGLDKYENSFFSLPPTGKGRAYYQVPPFSNNEELPGLQYANKSRNLVANTSQFALHNPNRYAIPVHADGAGLPFFGVPSTKEELNIKTRLAGLAVRYTQGSGLTQPVRNDVTSSSVKSALTGVLQSLIPDYVRRPLANILGFSDKTFEFGEIKWYNSYNPSFKYAKSLDVSGNKENRNPIFKGLTSDRTSSVTYGEIVGVSSSPLVDILTSLINVGSTNAIQTVPFTFRSETSLAERVHGSKSKDTSSTGVIDDRVIRSPYDNRLNDHIQTYSEIVSKRRNKDQGNLNITTPGFSTSVNTYENRLRDAGIPIVYERYGIDNSGAPSKENRFIDRINALDYREDYPDIPGKKLEDFVPFKFFHINLKRWIVFRAFITGINESVSSEWNSKKYIGRADKVYTYTGAERKLNFNFELYPFSSQEMGPLWRKINAFVGLCYPDYVSLGTTGGGSRASGQFMRGPFVSLTIGDMYNDVPGIIDSITLTVNDDTTWEIRADKQDLNGFDIARVPRHLQASVSFTIIGKSQYSSTGKFFDPHFV